METTWTDTIVTHLNQMRSGGEQAPKRGKKINVSAGKSIGAADLLPTLIESELNDNHSEQDIEINDDEGLNGISEENVSEGEEDNITEKENSPSTSKEDEPQDMTRTISSSPKFYAKVKGIYN
ncbi:hypothetical protein JTB14_007864 [Gonioctena quinquepunctata]|nr:hypothetical protein JTB14_007864 [Gonioctena quinquepunctata]